MIHACEPKRGRELRGPQAYGPQSLAERQRLESRHQNPPLRGGLQRSFPLQHTRFMPEFDAIALRSPRPQSSLEAPSTKTEQQLETSTLLGANILCHLQ